MTPVTHAERRGPVLYWRVPRTITVTTSEVIEAIEEPLGSIVGAAKAVLEKTPPELASDIIDRGVVLTGGGAMLRGIEQFITRAIGVPAYRAEEPMVAVAVGAGRALEDLAILRRMVAGLT